MCVSVAVAIQNEKAYAPYYIVMWVLSDSAIFFPPFYLINCTILGKKVMNMKCVFLLSPQLLSETFLILSRFRDIIINVHRASCKVAVILVRF